MVAENNNTGGQASEIKPPQPPLKTVKAVPTSPIYAMFDLVEIEGKQIIAGSIGFVDQFGMERRAKTASDTGIMNLGKHILAIFGGEVDITEPDEETKKQLALQQDALVQKAKADVVNAYQKKDKTNEGTS